MTTIYADFLRESSASILKEWQQQHNVLMTVLMSAAKDRETKDRAYLESLTDIERRKVLLRRRIRKTWTRYRNRWEQDFAWRFRAYPDTDY